MTTNRQPTIIYPDGHPAIIYPDEQPTIRYPVSTQTTANSNCEPFKTLVIPFGINVVDIKGRELIPVVRCYNCKYLNEKGFCEKHSRIKKEDMDFCSWGERKEDG